MNNDQINVHIVYIIIILMYLIYSLHRTLIPVTCDTNTGGVITTCFLTIRAVITYGQFLLHDRVYNTALSPGNE